MGDNLLVSESGQYLCPFYSFTVGQTSDVRIDLRSTDALKDDTYLYLISGSSKTGQILEQDDNDGDDRNSRITRQLTAGTYTIEATTRYALRTGGFTLSVAVNKPTAGVDDASVFVRQPVMLSAEAPAAMGSVSRYQWQRWTGSRWISQGAYSSSSTRSVSFSTPGTRTFRVVVTYSAGGTGTSVPVSAEWVKVANAIYSPISPDIGDSVTLEVDNDGAPSGTTYQWQRRSGSRWINVGSTSSSTTKSISYSRKITRVFRVLAQYDVDGTSVSDVSNTLHVTWGEWRIVDDLARDLDIALFGGDDSSDGGVSGQAATPGNQVLQDVQTKFLDCVNRDRESGQEFPTFYAVLAAYTGTIATTVNDCEGRTNKPTGMFDAYSSAVKTELGKLKGAKTLYDDYIAGPRGGELVRALGSAALLKLFGSATATDTETPTGAGMDCVPSTEPSTLQGKLDALNCLVFKTPHDFWVNITEDNRDTLEDDTEWLGVGNWECDVVFDGPLPSCRKHDVGFHSLQKFTGTDSTEILDRTWNPRNKALADAKFWADIMEHGCLGADDLEVWVCGVGEKAKRRAADVYFTAVAKVNNKGWPVTTEDLEDARAHRSVPATATSSTPSVSTHAYVDCEDEVPTVEDVTVTRDPEDDDFSVEWAHADGCVDEIVIGRIGAWLAIEFDNGEVGYDTDDNLRGTATSATFDLSPWEHLEPVGGLFEVYLYPENLEYGGESYIHEFTIDEVE